jgi:ubiquitin-activating enzyme E1
MGCGNNQKSIKEPSSNERQNSYRDNLTLQPLFMIEEKTEIDTNQYSRQLFTFGAETMGKLIKMKVFIQGMRGIGVETAKNLVLAGPSRVTIHDPELVSSPDLGTNFYLRESHVGNTSRATACLESLSTLNQYVNVDVSTATIDEKLLADYDVVCMTECYDREMLIRLNNFCRAQKPAKAFIWTGSLGLFGHVFCDFGDSHTIFDKDGEECKSCVVNGVTCEEKSCVTVIEDKRHGYSDGDWVEFTEVKGMSELNNQKFQITVLSPHTFTIGDTTKFSNYVSGGYATQTKVPFQKEYKSLEKALEDPYGPGNRELHDPDMDYERMYKPLELHLYLNSVLDFATQEGRLPEICNDSDADKFKVLVNTRFENYKDAKMAEEGGMRVEHISEELIKNIAYYAKTEVAPTCGFYGGIVSQEIVKYTGKYTPLHQFLLYETFRNSMPNEDETVTRDFSNDERHRDQVALFGREYQTKLGNTTAFMIGAGALGCELLKQAALMGLCCGPGGAMHCTDDDTIEISNLNRQFLFRKEHVGKSKSEVSCEAAKSINPNLNVFAYKSRVSSEGEHLFTDKFFDDIDYCIGAVDNVHARKYIDGKCLLHKKPLFDSGTLGTKCNAQCVVPHKTQSYGDSDDPAEEGVPMCTIRNYPYLIDHCIEYARANVFEGFITEGSATFCQYLPDPEGYISAKINVKNANISMVKDELDTLLKYAAVYQGGCTIESMVQMGRQLFQETFVDQIAQLLHCFPAGYVDKDGREFWVSPKRSPQLFDFDANDETHMNFVCSVVTIMKSVFNVKSTETLEQLKAMALAAKPVVAKLKKMTIKENDNDQVTEGADDDEDVAKGIAKKLCAIPGSTSLGARAVDFEKDDDNNGHISFMHATSNLRARNYRIAEISFQKVKFIAGKIIPAIATTTAMIVGAVGFELTKYAMGKGIDHVKNSFHNLALPFWIFTETMLPRENKDVDYDPIMMCAVKAIPAKWTSWDTLDVTGPLTVQGMIDAVKEIHGLKVTMIILGTMTVWMDGMGKFKERYF